MDAFLFTLALFSFWTLVGFATITLCPSRLRIIQGILISPAVGIAVTILPVFFINRVGIPVKDFGGILLPALAGLSILVLMIKRPLFPIKKILPFIAILIIALLLAARPMFSYGFDWLSYANDDMANYCLGAQRFLYNGFFDAFDINSFFAGKDYSQAFWFMHVLGRSRSGSELMLSTIWAVSGLNAHQIFMPVIMGLHLSLIAATGAMVSGMGMRKKIALIAMGVMAISPLSALGALYQLIGQVGGLTLLTAATTLMYRPQSFKSIHRLFIKNIPASLVFAAIFVWYPEVLPFFGLGWLLYIFILHIRKKADMRKVAVPAIIVGLLVLIILNKYVITALLFMLTQASVGSVVDSTIQNVVKDDYIFPFFLVPSGLANVWGLLPIAGSIQEPFVSVAILGALLLFTWLALRVIPPQVREVKAPVCVLIVMICMDGLLFYADYDFGLYKLAMFIQPYLLAVVAIELNNWKWDGAARKKFICGFTALLITLLPVGMSHFSYVKKSTGEYSSGFSEIPKASSLKINSQFKNTVNTILANSGPNAVTILDSNNVVLAKLQALYCKDMSMYFPGRDFFVTSAETERAPHFVNKKLGENSFEMRSEDLTGGRQVFYVYSSVMSDIFNSYGKPTEPGNNYYVIEDAPKNRLLYFHSNLGNIYYLSDRKKASFFQLESDPLYPGKLFASMGQHFLFQVINPSENPRLVMELTNTVVKQYNSELPKPIVQNTQLNFVGRGAGRVFSSPIEPTYVDMTPFISIDMGREGRRFSYTPKGLMQLYGRNVSRDPRLITAFGRDISLISEEQYQALKPPVALQNFPSDLSNKNLEYSGIYEDAWISEESFFVLSPVTTSRYLVIKGMVPLIKNPDFTSTITASINGIEVAQQHIGIDKFELKVPVTALEGRQRIDVSFSDYQNLPGDDDRIIGGKIEFLGFTTD